MRVLVRRTAVSRDCHTGVM